MSDRTLKLGMIDEHCLRALHQDDRVACLITILHLLTRRFNRFWSVTCLQAGTVASAMQEARGRLMCCSWDRGSTFYIDIK